MTPSQSVELEAAVERLTVRAWTPPMSDADRWASAETSEIEAELRRFNAEQMQPKPLATMGNQNDD